MQSVQRVQHGGARRRRRVMELHACYFKDLDAFSTDQRWASATAGKTGTRATGQRNWPTHPAVPPGTDDQNSTPARELEPPQPLLRSLDGGQHPCAKIGANVVNRQEGTTARREFLGTTASGHKGQRSTGATARREFLGTTASGHKGWSPLCARAFGCVGQEVSPFFCSRTEGKAPNMTVH